jgi:oxygen-independent coproporphyrinogen-3 oxidase
MEQFVGHLLGEYGRIENDLDLTTVYFGGGTPTALSVEMLDTILNRLQGARRLREMEVTMECNPSTLSSEKARLLLIQGVNRLSLGAQSFDTGILKKLGRTHTAEAIRDCFQTARDAGFANLSIDLIFGVPGQSLESWQETLREAVLMKPEHLSCYGLTYEEDTDFFLRHQRGELKANSELEASMFQMADEFLEAAGYDHYEISNYAKPGFRSRHNLSYWEGHSYYGIGPSAVSTLRGVRRQNGRWNAEGWQVETEENLSESTLASERMILGLRLKEGLDEVQFAKDFRFRPRDRWEKEVDFLIRNGLLEPDPQLHLTEKGRLLADEVAVHFCL